MEIGKEKQAFLSLGHLILHAHPVSDRTEIITEVKVAGGLNAGHYAHVYSLIPKDLAVRRSPAPRVCAVAVQ